MSRWSEVGPLIKSMTSKVIFVKGAGVAIDFWHGETGSGKGGFQLPYLGIEQAET